MRKIIIFLFISNFCKAQSPYEGLIIPDTSLIIGSFFDYVEPKENKLTLEITPEYWQYLNQQKQSKMKRFTYYLYYFNNTTTSYDFIKLGNDGWELVSVWNNVAYFKRELNQE
jgi:hypothetical protein